LPSQVSIIMYHYVRELKHSRYQGIKGLSVDRFKEQLEYIMKHYHVISMEEMIASIKSDRGLPRDVLLLTFDDAYIDHFTNVFPVLDELGIQGSFFPPAKAILSHEVLDVNKIHFVLASADNKLELVEEINSMLDEFRSEYSLKSNGYYFKKLAAPSRFDTEEVIFIKRILQRELPEELRKEIIRRLFNKYVDVDENVFSREMYMSIGQIKCMKRHGMFIGSHGSDHCWMGALDSESQEKEIDLSLKFLRKIGCDPGEWVMCYPYGNYDDSLLSILSKSGCIAGLTTAVRIADIRSDNPLTLPRLDTNDVTRAQMDGVK